MRALKALLVAAFVALALCAGFIVAAIAALVAAGYFLARRLRGASSDGPLARASSQRFSPPERGRRPPPAAETGDVIDVTATEVPSGR